MPKKEGPEPSSILYIRAESLEDVCRYACKFDFGSDNLLLTHEKGSGRLMALGEHIGNSTLAYYVMVKKWKKTIRYVPAKGDERERAEFTDSSAQQPSGTFNINVIEADLSPLKGENKVTQRDIAFIRLGDPEDLIKATLKKGVEEETLTQIYSFTRKGKRYLATFEMFKELENERKLFYYSPFNNKTHARYARYSYSDNKLDFTDSIGEHSYMYAKLINLAEPFPFFVPMPD